MSEIMPRLNAHEAADLMRESIDIIKYLLNCNDIAAAEVELDIVCYVFLENYFYGSAWGLAGEYRKMMHMHLNGETLH
jgi:hypothetical protein